MLTWPVIKTISFLVVCVGIFLIYQKATTLEAQVTPPSLPVFAINNDHPFTVSAGAYRIFDIQTGKVLAEQNVDKVVPIASVTKLLATTVLLKNELINEVGTVTVADVAADGRAGKLVPGEAYTYRELLFPLLLESSNDAAEVFVRATNGKVIFEMNDLVRNLGMKDTVLVDASGLGDANVSTVNDLSLFLTYLAIKDKHTLDITLLPQYVGPYTGWVNNSPVRVDAYRGGKHGYTVAAGRTLTAIFEEEFAAGKRELGYILLGSHDLAADTALLRSFIKTAVTFE